MRHSLLLLALLLPHFLIAQEALPAKKSSPRTLLHIGLGTRLSSPRQIDDTYTGGQAHAQYTSVNQVSTYPGYYLRAGFEREIGRYFGLAANLEFSDSQWGLEYRNSSPFDPERQIGGWNNYARYRVRAYQLMLPVSFVVRVFSTPQLRIWGGPNLNRVLGACISGAQRNPEFESFTNVSDTDMPNGNHQVSRSFTAGFHLGIGMQFECKGHLLDLELRAGYNSPSGQVSTRIKQRWLQAGLGYTLPVSKQE